MLPIVMGGSRAGCCLAPQLLPTPRLGLGQRSLCLPRAGRRETKILPDGARGDSERRTVPEERQGPGPASPPRPLPQDGASILSHLPGRTLPRHTCHPTAASTDPHGPDGSAAPPPPSTTPFPDRPAPCQPHSPIPCPTHPPRSAASPPRLPAPARAPATSPSSAPGCQHSGTKRYECLQLLSPKIPSDDTPG